MHVTLIGVPSFNLDAFLMVSNELWGFSLAEALDQRHGTSLHPIEKFLVCLAGFQQGRGQLTVPDHLLAYIELVWLVVADSEQLDACLNYLPSSRRLVVPTFRRHTSAALVTLEMAELKQACNSSLVADEDYRQLLTLMEVQLERNGLADLLKPAVKVMTKTGTLMKV